METITDGSRRTLPPVPRSSPALPLARDTRPPVPHRPPVPRPVATPATVAHPPVAPRDDPGQLFVAAVRAAAAALAAAAGARTAVVAEAIPPARHRRARCRVVLLGVDGTESEHAFLGDAGRPTAAAARALTGGMAGWLADGAPLDGRWALPDAGAAHGVVIDVPTWCASR